MAFHTDVAALLTAAGLGAVGSTITIGRNATIPTGDGPYFAIVETGGVAPTRVHNAGRATSRPMAQIVTRAKNTHVARSKAFEAFNALDGKFNVTVAGTFYLHLMARQEPTDMGPDDLGRAQYSFNIEAERQP
jgi:hypothetical protein